LWQINFTGREQIDLEIIKLHPGGKPPPVVAWHQTSVVQLAPDRVRSDFAIHLELFQANLTELHLACTPGFQPLQVLDGGQRPLSWEFFEFAPDYCHLLAVVPSRGLLSTWP